MIPHLVHVVWIGSKPFPYPSYLQSWQRHNPGWDVRLWTDDNRPHLGDNEPVFERIPHHSGRVNLLRLHLLHEHGGAYSDADSECLRPLSALGVPESATAWGMAGRRGNVQNATLAATPGHPVLADLIGRAPEHYRALKARQKQRGKPTSIFLVFGTRYISESLQADPGWHQVDAGCGYGSRRLICERTEQVPETVVVHDCAETWRAQLGDQRVWL